MIARAWAATALLAGVLASSAVGCRAGAPPPNPITVRCSVAPQPPRMGPGIATVTATQADGTPARGAQVRVEGNMAHPGMTPVFAEGVEVGPGKYEAALRFTMGGDWFLTVTVTPPNGATVERQFPVAGVRAE